MNWNDIFYYDESSPTCLRWKQNRYNPLFGNITCHANDAAGYLRFYKNGKPRNSCVGVGDRQYYIHRIIFEMKNSIKIPKKLVIDHLDGNPHNNSIQNLRLVTLADNSHNIKKMSHNKTGITGVVYINSTNCWRAIWHDGTGKQRSKSFSVNKYGDLAKQHAIDARNIAIQNLKDKNFLYTERHGI